MNITFTAHCVGRILWMRTGKFAFIWLAFQVWFVWATPGFDQSDDSSKKVVTFPLVPLQQSLCDFLAVPLLYLGVSNSLKVCGNLECRAEFEAQFCDIIRLPLLTHVQSIGDQHPTGKQGVGMCCSPCEVVLYGSCSEWHPCLPGRFSPSCHCAISQRCIAIYVTQSLKTFLCTTTSCHFNLNQEHCSAFVNIVLGRSHDPYKSQCST